MGQIANRLATHSFCGSPGEDVEAIPRRELAFSCRLERHLRLPWSRMRRAMEFVADSVSISQRLNSFAGYGAGWASRRCQFVV
jgi:hypothetical protein